MCVMLYVVPVIVPVKQTLSIAHVFVCLLLFVDGTQGTQINRVVSHPNSSVVITAHEDKQINFFDYRSGKQQQQQQVSLLIYLFTCVFTVCRRDTPLHDSASGRSHRTGCGLTGTIRSNQRLDSIYRL